MNGNVLDIPALLRLRGGVPQGAISMLDTCGDLSSHGAVLVFFVVFASGIVLSSSAFWFDQRDVVPFHSSLCNLLLSPCATDSVCAGGLPLDGPQVQMGANNVILVIRVGNYRNIPRLIQKNV